MKLYEILPQYRGLLDAYAGAETEEESEMTLAQLEEIDAAFEDKIESLVKAWKNEESDLPGLKDEIDRLRSICQMKEYRIASLKKLVANSILAVRKHDPRVKIGIGTVRVQKNSVPSVIFDGDAEKLPQMYRRTIPVQYECDKKALADRFKELEEAIDKALLLDPAANVIEITLKWREENQIPAEVMIERGVHVRL